MHAQHKRSTRLADIKRVVCCVLLGKEVGSHGPGGFCMAVLGYIEDIVEDIVRDPAIMDDEDW